MVLNYFGKNQIPTIKLPSHCWFDHENHWFFRGFENNWDQQFFVIYRLDLAVIYKQHW